MYIAPVKTISFGRSLTKTEEADFGKILHEAQRVLGIDEGKSTLIVHEPCLPQSSMKNTGASTISSKEALEFFDYMKQYLGINSVELLPPGDYKPIYRSGMEMSPNPYSTGSFGIGEQAINLELFTGEKYSKIITEEDIEKIVKNNNLSDVTNIDNVSGEGSAQRSVLKTAWERFLKLDSKEEIKKEFELYKKENESFLLPKSLFRALTEENGTKSWDFWPELDRDLLITDTPEAKDRIVKIAEKYKDDIDFYFFRQYLADKSLQEGKNALNARGIELIGDCPIGFSPDEIWAHHSAFREKHDIGWSFKSLNYEKLYKNDGSLDDAGKLLQLKLEYFLKRYDGLRLDVGWSYVTNRLEHVVTKEVTPEHLGNRAISLIEKTAKKVKGQDFDLSKIMYETSASGDYSIFRNHGTSDTQKPEFAGRTKIFTSSHMSQAWGSSEFYLKEAGFLPEELMLGVSNHDSVPLRKISQDLSSAEGEKQVSALSSIFRTPKEFVEDPKNFVKLKNAEIMGSKNRMYFFMDVFGRDEVFNNMNKEDKTVFDFRYKIPENYKSAYHKSLQEGYGLNMMESLKLNFMRKGYDVKYPDLFKKISKYSNILRKKSFEAVDLGKDSLAKTGIYGACAAGIIGIVFGAYKLFKGKNKEPQAQLPTQPQPQHQHQLQPQQMNITLNEGERNIFQKLL